MKSLFSKPFNPVTAWLKPKDKTDTPCWFLCWGLKGAHLITIALLRGFRIFCLKNIRRQKKRINKISLGFPERQCAVPELVRREAVSQRQQG